MDARKKHSLAKRAEVVVAAIALSVAVYALTPTIRNQFGAPKPASARRALDGFTLPKLGGGTWSLAEQRGRVVLVNFWATWCPPCRIETPALVSAYARYRGRGFTIAGVSMDDDPAAVAPSFARKYGIDYPILIPQPTFSLLSQVSALPTSVLVDRDGRIARVYEGMITEAALSRDIESLLGENQARTE